MRKLTRFGCCPVLLLSVALVAVYRPAAAQVSPAEIRSSDLRALEETYFPQLKQLNKDIRTTRFPFPFVLSRYVGVDPQAQSALDTRGLEFISFESRTILKVSGNYNAAFQAGLLTQNERAAHLFKDVITPILGLVSRDFPADLHCDGVGFEISYHVRTHGKGFEYEGGEILVVVFERSDAFAYTKAADDDQRQAILNRSETYVNGSRFGLALNDRDPLDVESLEHSPAPPPATSPAPTADGTTRTVNPALLTAQVPSLPTKPPSESAPPAVPPTQADADRLQQQHQAELDALVKNDGGRLHFVDYAPPSFAIFRNQIVLQITLRNTLSFAPESSIYRRAAQSFDLFLAPLLKDLLDKLPADPAFDLLDITVLNRPLVSAAAASEAVEFISSRRLLRQFADAEITNQQVIDQSAVLVNGVRISLNLQLVE